MAQKITDIISRLLIGERKKVVITSLNTYEAIRYSLILGLDVWPNSRLIMTNRTAQHILDSGHFTGTGIKNKKDLNPLTQYDIISLPQVFKRPDKIIFVGKGKIGYRVIVERRLRNYNRLILDYDDKNNQFFVAWGLPVLSPVGSRSKRVPGSSGWPCFSSLTIDLIVPNFS